MSTFLPTSPCDLLRMLKLGPSVLHHTRHTSFVFYIDLLTFPSVLPRDFPSNKTWGREPINHMTLILMVHHFTSAVFNKHKLIIIFESNIIISIFRNTTNYDYLWPQHRLAPEWYNFGAFPTTIGLNGLLNWENG